MVSLLPAAILWFLLSPESVQSVRNITIDDTNGDPERGATATYNPSRSGNTWEPTPCNGCGVQPDMTLSEQGSWTAITINNYTEPLHVSINLQFNGNFDDFLLMPHSFITQERPFTCSSFFRTRTTKQTR
jgi:hypothetical protein